MYMEIVGPGEKVYYCGADYILLPCCVIVHIRFPHAFEEIPQLAVCFNTLAVGLMMRDGWQIVHSNEQGLANRTS